MADETVEQKLAAIMAADVAGYSALMGDDERATVATLDAYRGVFRIHVAAEHGRVVDTAGDSVLAVFPSTIGAVRAALAIQDDLAPRNEELPESRRMRFRIGVNLGDVIEKADGTVYGDGVNIAARLESLAEPGGLTISGTTFDQVDGKLDIVFDSLGENAVKNIAKPVRAYRAELGAVVTRPAATGEAERPSIAVLAFENLSGDPEQEYFADGIAEDLITAFSGMRWLSVTARNSTFSYKGKSPDIRDVGRELGVRYVLEGSVRKGGNRVRISAQLIDASDGNHIWAQRYDRELEDIFDVQDEITLTIAGAIEPELAQIERERARRKPAENLDAWDFCQRGLWHLWQLNKDDNAEAQKLFRRAIEIEPRFAAAHANLSCSHYFDSVFVYDDSPRQNIHLAATAAKKSLAIDDRDAMAHCTLGRTLSVQGDYPAAIAELRAALDLNPSFALAHYALGLALLASGQGAQQALRELAAARQLSPHDPYMWLFEMQTANAHISLGQFEEAEHFARSAMRRPGAGYWAYAALASALGNLGRIEEARPVCETLLNLKPDFSRQFMEDLFNNIDQSFLTPYFEGLYKAGLRDPDQAAAD